MMQLNNIKEAHNSVNSFNYCCKRQRLKTSEMSENTLFTVENEENKLINQTATTVFKVLHVHP